MAQTISFGRVFQSWITQKSQLVSWEEKRRKSIQELLTKIVKSAIPDSDEWTFKQDALDQKYIGVDYEQIRRERDVDPKIWVLLEHPGKAGSWLEDVLVDEANVLSLASAKGIKLKDFPGLISQGSLQIIGTPSREERDELNESLNIPLNCVQLLVNEDGSKTIKILEVKKKTWTGGTGGRSEGYRKLFHVMRVALSPYTNFLNFCVQQNIHEIQFRHGVLYDPEGNPANLTNDKYRARQEDKVYSLIEPLIRGVRTTFTQSASNIIARLDLFGKTSTLGHGTFELTFSAKTIYYNQIFTWFLNDTARDFDFYLNRILEIKDIDDSIDVILAQRKKALEPPNLNDFYYILYVFMKVNPRLLFPNVANYGEFVEKFSGFIQHLFKEVNNELGDIAETDLEKIMIMVVLLTIANVLRRGRGRSDKYLMLSRTKLTGWMIDSIQAREQEDIFVHLQQKIRNGTRHLSLDPYIFNQ